MWFEPQQSTAPSTSCPSTFHLDVFNLLPRALRRRRVNGLRFLSPSFKFSSYFFASCTETQPGDTAGFWLSKADLKTLTFGSIFQVAILPTFVGKDAKQLMAVLPGPLPDGRRSGGDEGLGSRLGQRCVRCYARRLGAIVSGRNAHAKAQAALGPGLRQTSHAIMRPLRPPFLSFSLPPIRG